MVKLYRLDEVVRLWMRPRVASQCTYSNRFCGGNTVFAQNRKQGVCVDLYVCKPLGMALARWRRGWRKEPSLLAELVS